MIHSFSLQNFHSFLEKSTISFSTNKSKPKNIGFFMSPSSTVLSKIEAIIGSNASGKTTIMKVLPFIKWLIVDAYNAKPDDSIPVQPFIFGDNKNNPIKLTVEFEIDKDIYQLNFTLTQEKIISENLKVRNLTAKRNTIKILYTREWSNELNDYIFDEKKYKFPNGTKKLLRTNSSLISSAIRGNHELSLLISNYWANLKTNVREMGYQNEISSVNNLINNKISNLDKNQTLKANIENLLTRFDLGLGKLYIKKETVDGDLKLNSYFTHSYKGKYYDNLPIKYESSGTMRMFVLLSLIIDALESGGIVVLDEIDVNLHPEMISAIIDLFISSDSNPHNAQIIFSTHSQIIIQRLDKEQVNLVQKDNNCVSHCWRLDEIKGIRPDENLFTKYISGAYGAYPRIDVGGWTYDKNASKSK